MTDITTFVATRVPTGRDLQRSELVELVTAIGTTPALWQSKVRHDAGERIYVQLYRDTYLDVWMICWLDDQKTGYHDHDLSSGAVYVCEGTLYEDFPPHQSIFHRAEAVYEEVEGWTEELTEARVFEELPEAARRYVSLVSDLAGVPVRTLSVGPDREQTMTVETP